VVPGRVERASSPIGGQDARPIRHGAIVEADARNRNLRSLVLPLDLDDSFRFSCEP